LNGLNTTFVASYKTVSKSGKIAIATYVIALVITSLLDSALLVLLSWMMSDSVEGAINLSDSSTFAILIIVLGKPVVVTYINRYIFLRLANEETKIASLLMKTAMDRQWGTDKQLQHGAFLNLVTEGPSAVIRGILMRGCIAISSSINILIVFLTVFYIDAFSALAFAAYAIAIASIANHHFSQKVKYIGDEMRIAVETQIDLTTRGIALSKVFKIMQSKSYMGNFSDQRSLISKLGAKSEVLSQLPRAFFEFFLGLLVVIITVIYKTDLGIFKLNLVVFAAAAFRIFPLFSQLQAVAIQMSIERSNAQRCLDALVENGDNIHSLDVQNFDLDAAVVVQLDSVSYRYQEAALEAIDRISLTIKEGDTLAVIGRSGSGKSTLIDMLIGAVKPSTGRIIWNENYVGKIGFLPQISIATGLKVANSIALEWKIDQIDQKRIDDLLIDVKKMKMFDQHDFNDKKKDSELSVGQLQVIGLMRAVYRSPEILILDEPTSALDEESQIEIMRFVDTMNIKVKVVVAHRLATIRSSSRIICMEAGKIIADGTFDEVIKSIPNIENYIESETAVNGSKNESGSSPE